MRKKKLSPRLARIVDQQLVDFKNDLERLERRHARLIAARQGRAIVKRHYVEPHVRPRRSIDGYWRTSITVKK